MAARAAARDSEMIRIDAPLLRVMPDESNGAMNILHDFRDGKLRLRPVDDRENGVTVVGKRPVRFWIDRFVRREPATADHENDAVAIAALNRFNYVKS